MIRNSCSPRRPAGVRTRRPDRVLGHRQHRRRNAERARDLGLGGGQGAALGDEVSPVEAGGEVAVGEREPARSPELLEPLVDGEGVVADAPAALLVDRVGEPVRAEIRVGADEQAVDLAVVGGVGDHGELGAEDLLEARRELRPAGAAGEDDDGSTAARLGFASLRPVIASGRPVIRIPAWVL